MGPSKEYILKENQQPTQFIHDAHQVGLKVHPYTLRPENSFLPQEYVCNPLPEFRSESGALKEYQAFFRAGVDGIFTDDPGLGRKALTAFKTLPK